MSSRPGASSLHNMKPPEYLCIPMSSSTKADGHRSSYHWESSPDRSTQSVLLHFSFSSSMLFSFPVVFFGLLIRKYTNRKQLLTENTHLWDLWTGGWNTLSFSWECVCVCGQAAQSHVQVGRHRGSTRHVMGVKKRIYMREYEMTGEE